MPKIPLTSITLPPEAERDPGDITSLANSIRIIGGLIHPIVIAVQENGTYTLRAGRRRLAAHKHLGWEEIEATFFHDLSESKQILIEIEENLRRKNLSWPEEVSAIERYAAICHSEGLKRIDIASNLGLDAGNLTKILTVANALKDDPKLSEASTLWTAYQLHIAKIQKTVSNAFENIRIEKLLPASNIIPLQNPSPPKRDPSLPCAQIDFASWAPTYEGKRFNLIHCDFPYGLNMGSANLQNSSDRWDLAEGRYEDEPEVFDRLVRAFFDNQERFVSDLAHCIFWTAHKNYGRIASRFTHYGWTVCETPLIWHKSDNAGIAPDTRRWPRRTYEIAVFASRGDRKILKVKAASVALPTTKDYHLSEKPLGVLRHFFEMVCDDTTEILDPTAGSGTALQVAQELGASRIVGLEIQPSYVKICNDRLRAPADKSA